MIPVNLVPMTRRTAAARRRRIHLWSAGGAVYGAVLAGGLTVVLLSGPSGGASLDARIQEVAIQTAHDEVQTKTVLAEFAEAQSRLRAIQRVTGHPDWSVLLNLVSGTREGRVVFDLCELEPVVTASAGAARSAAPPAPGAPATPPAPPEYVLHLNGIAQQQQEIPKFVLRLEALGLFARVVLLESQSRPLDETEVFAFRIECVLRDSGGTNP